jgi:hypothetical protein
VQLNLIPHPASPAGDPPFNVWATVDHAGAFGAMATTNIWFGIDAPAHRFKMTAGEPRREDNLWQTSCLEAFIQAEGEDGYREWNFAPNGSWAAYDFSGYRDRAADPEVATPYIRIEDNLTWWTLGATISVEAGVNWRLGLSAVLEEADGTKSYWALAHQAEQPDFHDAGCFTARLA